MRLEGVSRQRSRCSTYISDSGHEARSMMLSPRALMDLALKATVVPELRSRGFTGSYPHFRRLHTTHVDLLSFQFDVNGGGFCIDMCRCGVGGITTPQGRHIPASEVKIWDLPPNDRFRMTRGEGAAADSWFRYESGDYHGVAETVLAQLPR